MKLGWGRGAVGRMDGRTFFNFSHDCREILVRDFKHHSILHVHIHLIALSLLLDLLIKRKILFSSFHDIRYQMGLREKVETVRQSEVGEKMVGVLFWGYGWKPNSGTPSEIWRVYSGVPEKPIFSSIPLTCGHTLAVDFPRPVQNTIIHSESAPR